MELEPEYERKGETAEGTETGYTVEARNNYPLPETIGRLLLDNRWQRVNFPRSDTGVPQCVDYQRHVKMLGLLSLEAAQALRWWLHADARNESKYCVETRIVRHKISYSYKIEAVAVVDVVPAPALGAAVVQGAVYGAKYEGTQL
jgi:hypothetical protein